ncbi:hypothetical protein ACFSC3_20630 [Sphingomonas floccifaciens]|jgi:hypothetical protein|uniref:Uncharacterized protein n=1 Tax=Sphingomonas floccifaciens TaxID=1844115 RepID=A0ABW4NIZ7_9SPHN|nr:MULTISPECIES: hypothetical protein [Sphingomonas]MBN2970441.1 hypothetical protein [Roseomonas aeriglobus]MCH4895012.1 hypothetical protein [Sphingomonas sp. SFZ2018-12]
MVNVTAIVAALVGSLAGGVGHYLLARRSSRQTRRAMMTGLVAEVAVLRHLLDLQFGKAGTADGPIAIFPLTYHGELAAVYDALSAHLGSLDEQDAERIVRFHTLCKTIIGMADTTGAPPVAPALIAETLTLGEAIVADHRG